MQTSEKITEKIKNEKELLSTFSRNNKKNAEIYLNEIELRLAKYSAFRDKVVSVLDERRNRIKSIEPDHRIPDVEKRLEELKYKTIYLNTVNSSYEKTGLDRVIYNISKYYKGNFAKVSSDLLSAIEIFEKVGITITGKDFIYNKLAEEYMNVFLAERSNLGSETLRHAFEKVYWKQPNIIKYIQLNFRYLYFKYLKEFDTYVKNEEDKFHSIREEIINELKHTSREYHNIIKSSDYLYLNKFIAGELNVVDYSIKSIDSLIKIYADNVSDESAFEKLIDKLNITVLEYKKYLKYKFIIEDVKKIFKEESDKSAFTSKSKLKDIKKLEMILEKSSSAKSFKLFSKPKKVESDKIIEQLMTLYSELDEVIFKEKVKENVVDDSKIIDILGLGSSYFIYLAKVLKTKDSTISDKEIIDFYNEINLFLISYDHSLITNLNAFDEYDLAMIISDKYKLDNLKLTIEMLASDNIDKVIEQTDKIINYFSVKALTILKITDIEDLFKIDKKIKK